MGTFRLYTGEDGQSHIETISLAEAPAWTQGVDTTKISFQEQPVGNYLDWHPAPRRQFVIILSGQLEIGLGDGTKHVFGPGDAPIGGRHHGTGAYDGGVRRRGVRHGYYSTQGPIAAEMGR